MSVQVLSHWHPNLTINLIDDHTPWQQGSVPSPLNDCTYQPARIQYRCYNRCLLNKIAHVCLLAFKLAMNHFSLFSYTPSISGFLMPSQLLTFFMQMVQGPLERAWFLFAFVHLSIQLVLIHFNPPYIASMLLHHTTMLCNADV